MAFALKRPGLLLTSAAALLLAGLAALLLRPPAYQPTPLPVPNGYDDLVAAGKMITDRIPEPTASLETRRAFIVQQSNALARARLGLSRPMAAPVSFTPGPGNPPSPAYGALKTLARTVRLEARLAQEEGRTQEALLSGLDLLRMGKGVMNGGIAIDGMVGLALEASGLEEIKGLVPHLAPPGWEQLAAGLQSLLDQHETSQSLARRERVWCRHVFGWRWHFARLVQSKSLKAAETQLRSKLDAHLQEVRTLLTQAEGHYAKASPR
jgi:hypothetical protein